MIEAIKQKARGRGDRLAVVRAERLAALAAELQDFRENNELNGFQEYILQSMYTLSLPEADFPMRSIIVLAMHRPTYAPMTFAVQGHTYACSALVSPDVASVDGVLSALAAAGYHVIEAPMLPLKRLAVQSGIARYGRNNITYVDGMGSQAIYAGFFSDLPCDADEWGPMRNAPDCDGCDACINACPTDAILPDRFLIDNTRCLSAINEMPGDFPDWLPPDVHHTPYDCLKCQLPCPMNREELSYIGAPVHFDEAETAYLLRGEPYEDMPQALMDKARPLDLFKWSGGLSRNLRAIMAREPVSGA